MLRVTRVDSPEDQSQSRTTRLAGDNEAEVRVASTMIEDTGVISVPGSFPATLSQPPKGDGPDDLRHCGEQGLSARSFGACIGAWVRIPAKMGAQSGGM